MPEKDKARTPPAPPARCHTGGPDAHLFLATAALSNAGRAFSHQLSRLIGRGQSAISNRSDVETRSPNRDSDQHARTPTDNTRDKQKEGGMRRRATRGPYRAVMARMNALVPDRQAWRCLALLRQPGLLVATMQSSGHRSQLVRL